MRRKRKKRRARVVEEKVAHYADGFQLAGSVGGVEDDPRELVAVIEGPHSDGGDGGGDGHIGEAVGAAECVLSNIF